MTHRLPGDIADEQGDQTGEHRPARLAPLRGAEKLELTDDPSLGEEPEHDHGGRETRIAPYHLLEPAITAGFAAQPDQAIDRERDGEHQEGQDKRVDDREVDAQDADHERQPENGDQDPGETHCRRPAYTGAVEVRRDEAGDSAADHQDDRLRMGHRQAELDQQRQQLVDHDQDRNHAARDAPNKRCRIVIDRDESQTPRAWTQQDLRQEHHDPPDHAGKDDCEAEAR